MMDLFRINLQLFADPMETKVNANKTSQTSMSPTMKTFYDTALLENARPDMIFNQFGDKQRMHGNKIEWRKFDTFDKALDPITEGVTPNGKKFGMTKMEAGITQHGDYTAVTDRLELESYDDVIMGATEEMGSAGGATFDTLTRNILIGGNCVMYAKDGDTVIESRADLTANCKITPELINKANTWLKKNKAPKINDSYVALIHPSVAEDLRESNEWKEFHKYNEVSPIWSGEIGKLHGIRFIESTECKVHAPAYFSAETNITTVNTAVNASTSVVVDGKLTVIPNTEAYIAGNLVKITAASVSGNTTTLTVAPAVTAGKGAVVCGIGAGKDGSATYDTLVLGNKAYGVLDPEGEGMQMIVKDKKEIGGPLELYSTIGYKFCHGAKILYQERMLRLETGSSYSSIDEEN